MAGAPHVYDWTAYDTADSPMSAPATAGMRPIGLISLNPEWARDTDYLSRPSGPIEPEHIPDFIAFVKVTIGKYSAAPYNIKYWMIYGEPDCVDYTQCNFYGTWGDRPDLYTQLLAQLYPAVKADYPDVSIMMGNMAMDWFAVENGGGPFRRDFFQEAMAAGIWQFVDVIAFNYFPEFALEWSAYGPDIVGKIAYIRGIMASYPDSLSRKLMCVEIAVIGPEGNATLLEAQSAYITKLYARSQASGLEAVLYLGTKEWYGGDGRGRGLLFESGARKPAFYAYQFYASEMASTRYVGLASSSTSVSE